MYCNVNTDILSISAEKGSATLPVEYIKIGHGEKENCTHEKLLRLILSVTPTILVL